MAQINQNGIIFNNYKTLGIEKEAGPLILPIQGPDEDGGIINAVDIDWNGANLATKSQAQNAVDTIELPTALNTTRDLFANFDERIPFIRFGEA